MKSDYWPGQSPNISSLVHGSALKEWELLMFHTPGTSQGKYITVLDEIAYSFDRVCIKIKMKDANKLVE